MMAQIVRLLSFFAALGSASGARRARTKKTASNTNCGSLLHVSAGGENFGAASTAVCAAWPGEFPVGNADELQRLLAEAMEDGGAWDEINKVKQERSNNPGFCWRGDTLRPKSRSCEMKANGECYGPCPYGYKPKLLSGKFAPVCNSACSDGTLPVACGFGCARGIGECTGALLHQVGNVTQAVAAVFSVATGNKQVLDSVNQIIDLVEFIVSTLVKVVRAAKKVRSSAKPYQMAGVLMILFVHSVDDPIGKVRELVSLATGLFDDIGEVKLDVNSIVTTLVTQTQQVVEGAANFIKSWSFPHCKPANDVAFTFDEMGDDRLMGPWVQRGTMHGKPKYTLKGKQGSIVEWYDNHWEVFVDGWCGATCRKPLYTNDAQSYDFPVEGWKVASGAAPAPVVIAMRPALEE